MTVPIGMSSIDFVKEFRPLPGQRTRVQRGRNSATRPNLAEEPAREAAVLTFELFVPNAQGLDQEEGR